jgi:hypothetical protein
VWTLKREPSSIDLLSSNILNFFQSKLDRQTLRPLHEFQKSVLTMFGSNLIQKVLGISHGTQLSLSLPDWLHMKLSLKKKEGSQPKRELSDSQNTTELRQREKGEGEKRKLKQLKKQKVKKMNENQLMLFK